ncbi:spermidine synthase [Halocatena pleomorpha]|uniref:Spermidine synthase n=1 Tax=Halocatena pleomorpha TaxID=1785090 RepID=A0A3P3RJH7_9EURY|nr:spermidine synthase [Halocatena pleomorpha]RRJ33525.1 spermidine synthase [Halocatena pleomorpha]
MKRSLRSRRFVLLSVTFVVSFCSFAYEFVYSELLTVMYGGTVTQYVITVGLYFFSLGIGAGLSDDLGADRPANFFRTEVYLATVAPAGFLLVVALNSVTLPSWIPAAVVWVLARLPVIAVGVLSGFELPLLTRMVQETDEDPSSIGGVTGRVSTLGRRGLELFWHTHSSGETRSGLSVVLALDYIGGLAGAVVYARLLYPRLGLVTTTVVLSLINAVTALVFLVRFSERWGVGGGGTGLSFATEPRVLLVVCLLLTAGHAGALTHHKRLDNQVTEMYLEQKMEAEYAPGTMKTEVLNQKTTKYQHLVRYRRTWTASSSNPYFTGRAEQCLRLGMDVQLCESWADSYHNGLVDVPMSMYEHTPDTEVLVIGGGDWIAIDHLRSYNVSVDQVDLDAQFMNHTKRTPFFREWHNDSYTYSRLNTTVEDGYTHLQRTDKQYDLILLDVPGASDDDLLKLYSTEFYRLLRTHLTDGGLVGTWLYSPNTHPQHHKAYTNTLREAGFTQQLPYSAWEDTDSDGRTERVERFSLLAPTARGPIDTGRTAYVRRYAERYETTQWEPVPRYAGVRSNSIFHPNYDIIVDR